MHKHHKLGHRRDTELLHPPATVDLHCLLRRAEFSGDLFVQHARNDELLQSVQNALIRSAEQRRRSAEQNEARRLLDLLTPREFEVMQLVITGMLNKQIAGELGTAEKTVKVHRHKVMQKLGVTSVAALVRLVARARIAPVGNK